MIQPVESLEITVLVDNGTVGMGRWIGRCQHSLDNLVKSSSIVFETVFSRDRF